MGIRINTNVPSINTRRHLSNSTNAFNKSMEKLSSGLRINRAGDDAAGLAISENLKSDIRALNQAARNAADGISLIQTAEGSLDEVSNILLRMKELAEQALNGTLSDTDRGYLNAEFDALKSEINRISDSVDFNGVKLLDGSGTSVAIQVGIGTSGSDSVAVDLTTDVDTTGLGLAAAVDTASNAGQAMDQIDDAISTVVSSRGELRRGPEPARELDPQHQHDVGEPLRREQPHPRRRCGLRDVEHDVVPDPAAGRRGHAGTGQHDKRPGDEPARRLARGPGRRRCGAACPPRALRRCSIRSGGRYAGPVPERRARKPVRHSQGGIGPWVSASTRTCRRSTPVGTCPTRQTPSTSRWKSSALGLRINRAGDDAAGLAISENLKSDIRALDQAARNAADGISLIQTAEGSLDEVSNILLRMKELAEQSLNGTLSDTDRGYLNAEFSALSGEIDRISDGVDFNGVKLLDGSGGTVAIQVGIGTSGSDSVAVDLGDDLDATGLGLSATIDSASGAGTAMDEIDDAISTVVSARGDFGAIQNRLESSIRNINMTSENLSAANSRIRDVDVAHETSSLTSFQILQQAGVAMLAQANMTTGLAMNLLG
jgi:flagellin